MAILRNGDSCILAVVSEQRGLKRLRFRLVYFCSTPEGVAIKINQAAFDDPFDLPGGEAVFCKMADYCHRRLPFDPTPQQKFPIAFISPETYAAMLRFFRMTTHS
jgi:hypothetical protein